MAKIWAYGGVNTKTSTGKKWEGNVIAVPKGWKTGVEYEITLEDGTTTRVMAVDSTGGDSFSMPRGSAFTGKNCEIKPVNIEVASVAVEKKASEAKTPSLDEQDELARFFNTKGKLPPVIKPDGSKFTCKGCLLFMDEAEVKRLYSKMLRKVEVDGQQHMDTFKYMMGKHGVSTPQKSVAPEGMICADGICSIANTLQSSGMKEEEPKKTGVTGSYQMEIWVGKKYRKQQVYFAQEAERIPVEDGLVKTVAHSKRPMSYADGQFFVLSNYSRKLEDSVAEDMGNGKTQKKGLMAWISNLSYQPDKLGKEKSVVCECMGKVTAGGTEVTASDGIFSRALNEFIIDDPLSKPHVEENQGNVYTLKATGRLRNNMFFDNMSGVSLSGKTQELSGDVRISTTDVKQGLKSFHSDSRLEKDGNVTTITTNYYYDGKSSRKGYDSSGSEERKITQISPTEVYVVTTLNERGIDGVERGNRRTVRATEVNGVHNEVVDVVGWENGKVTFRAHGTGSRAIAK